jgi:hypothetical protein
MLIRITVDSWRFNVVKFAINRSGEVSNTQTRRPHSAGRENNKKACGEELLSEDILLIALESVGQLFQYPFQNKYSIIHSQEMKHQM